VRASQLLRVSFCGAGIGEMSESVEQR